MGVPSLDVLRAHACWSEATTSARAPIRMTSLVTSAIFLTWSMSLAPSLPDALARRRISAEMSMAWCRDEIKSTGDDAHGQLETNGYVINALHGAM